MKRAIFLDIEGTLTQPISSSSEYFTSEYVKLLPGVETALNYYLSREPEQLIVGISNRGEDGELYLEQDLEEDSEQDEEAQLEEYLSNNSEIIDVPIHQPQSNVDIVIEEMKYTLSLLPQLKAIYFCPNMKGRSCWRVTRNSAVKISKDLNNHETYIPQKHSFRKPGAGMIFVASLDYDIDLDQSWMVGTTAEDKDAAANAQIDFMPARQWRNQFLSVT
ncbi:MAG: hypothetical protein ACFB02_21900 [Mastigocoleus sp.]